MTMPFIDLTAQQKRLRGEIEARLNAVLDHGGYIMGAEVAELEAAFCDWLGVKHTISCSSGTDALILGLLGLLFDLIMRFIIARTIPWRGKG